MLSIEVENWAELQDFIEKQPYVYQKFAGDFVYFRGQSDFRWEIHSSISRIVKDDAQAVKSMRGYEILAQVEFKTKFHLMDSRLSYPEGYDPILLNIDMQHFSFPTRLVDWTRSPYIAMYFAVNENFEADGAMYMWLNDVYEKNMKKKFSDFSSIFGGNILNHDGYDFVKGIAVNRQNERQIRQQGVFTVSNNALKPHCSLIQEHFEDEGADGLLKIKIPKHLKLEALARLRIMNISAESLFPGLDGLGRATKEQLLLRRWAKM